ncbi:hypothetical protein AN402_1085 [Bacillus wiedmannii]|nr:hypothetical protein AN402_1085 [Bacillus wiedmannii]
MRNLIFICSYISENVNKFEWVIAILEIVKPYMVEKDFEQVMFKTVVLMQEEMDIK